MTCHYYLPKNLSLVVAFCLVGSGLTYIHKEQALPDGDGILERHGPRMFHGAVTGMVLSRRLLLCL